MRVSNYCAEDAMQKGAFNKDVPKSCRAGQRSELNGSRMLGLSHRPDGMFCSAQGQNSREG